MSCVRRTPLRILNEPAGFMGLTAVDLCGLGYLLVIAHSLLDSVGAGFLAFAAVAACGWALVGVRLKFRRRIIRDFLFKLFGPEVIYDPET